MKKAVKMIAFALICCMLIPMGIASASGSPSSSTWWPPGGSLWENDEEGEEEGKFISNGIDAEKDQTRLGKGFLFSHVDGLRVSDDMENAQNAVKKVLVDEGYSLPNNVRVMPINAYELTPKEGATGPYKVTIRMDANPVNITSVNGDFDAEKVNSESLETWMKNPAVYALHYKGATANKEGTWELLKASLKKIEVPSVDGQGTEFKYEGTVTTDSLSPFYFFMVMEVSGTTKQSYDLQKPTTPPETQPVTPPETQPQPETQPEPEPQPQPEPEPEPEPPVEMPEQSHQTGYFDIPAGMLP